MSLTDSDRTLLGDPPLAEETDCDVEMGLATGRRNALVQVEPESIDTIPELETVKFFFKVCNLETKFVLLVLVL